LKTALPKFVETFSVRKALVVTGRSLHDKTDVVRRVENILKERDAHGATFYEIGQHAPIAGIRNGVKAFRDAGADFIVSIGGGSPIDASKAIIHAIQKEDGGAYHKQIAIPTGLSAAEYTIGGGFTNEQGEKTGVHSQELAPAGIILDAELTLATPERLWLSTGIRALDHAVENLYRPLVPYPVKVLCYAAIADLFKYLPESKANPQAIDVRQKLQLASWMSLWPLKLEKYSAIGLSHALGHRLGATYDIPHGITSCLTLAPVVALKADIASQEDKEFVAAALFHLRQPSTGSVDGDVRKVASEIDGLVTRLGLKSNLTDYKVPIADLPKIAGGAIGGQDGPDFPKVVKLLEGLYL
jgi:alcohol dehydrogenase class IV